jgi:hypothetical protein
LAKIEMALKISCETRVILSQLCANPAWEIQMRQDGLVILLIGADLDKFDAKGSIKTPEQPTNHVIPVYLALGIAGEQNDIALGDHKSNFPHRDLFFKCLKPWRWLNEEAKDIVIEESNIGLNISEYYRVPHTRTAMTNVCDARRLSREKPDAASAKCINDKYYTHAVSNGHSNIERIMLFRYGDKDDCLFMLIYLGITKLTWSFVSPRCST